MLTFRHRFRPPRFWWGLRHAQHGLSILEVAIGTGVSAILVAALFTFVARSFAPPRQQYEQGRITEEARIQMNRVSDLLRNAVDVDFNGNGKIDSLARQEQWLQEANDYKVVFYSRRDVEDNDRLELIRIELIGSNLVMEVSSIVSGACFGASSERVVARSVRNLTEGVPLFTYYQSGDTPLVTPVSMPILVKRLGFNLVIDADVQQLPQAAHVRTAVTPRKGVYAVTPVGSPPACGDCLDNDLDGRVDRGITNALADPGCLDTSDTSEKGDLQCDDGFDNDGDTKIDYQAYGGGDPTCTSPEGTSES